MAPFDQRGDCGPLATAAFADNDKLQLQSNSGMQEYELESESESTKEVNLLFGCLDLDFCWSPCPASDSTVITKCSGDDNMDANSDAATELCEIGPPVTPVSTTSRSAVDEKCLPSSQSIILQSIISYPSSENETINPLIPVWQQESSQSLDEFLSTSQNSADSGGDCLDGDDNGSELSFSYSSFSESDSAAHVEEMDEMTDEDDIHDSASSGDDSVLSFDPSDFLEDDDESSSIRNGTCTGAPQMKRLGTIMECYEEFSSSTLGSDRKKKTIIPRQLFS